LSAAERRTVLELANSPEHRNLSPKQIVPKLADSGCYVASESTFYRVLRNEGLLAHRGRAKAASSKAPKEHIATAPLEVWSWDITYLRSDVVGKFYYLYLHVDVWSRKIVGWAVHETECSELAASALNAALRAEDIDGRGLVLHQDNGSPMKGATLKATLEHLGVIASYSRPRVSDDNPYSEALFRTLKYRPEYPRRPFVSIEEARAWVRDFVACYNHEHLHSGVGFVTPAERHAGRAEAVLAARRAVYASAYLRNPTRWSNAPRAWKQPTEVRLNPLKANSVESKPRAVAA
jgi:transposase InsO family protein